MRGLKRFMNLLFMAAVISSLFTTRALADESPDEYLQLEHEVPRDLLKKALDYLNRHAGSFDNRNVVSIVDYRPRSDQYRVFVVDLRSGRVGRYHTAHGAGSVKGDPAYAVRFGNEIGSMKSSLGFARTGRVYHGSQKRSLELEGLSSTNSNLQARGIIVHGADQVHEADVIEGVGAGCLMLDWSVRDEVINKIRGGSLVYFGYSHPDTLE